MLVLQVLSHGEASGLIIYSKLNFKLLYCVDPTVSAEVNSRNPTIQVAADFHLKSSLDYLMASLCLFGFMTTLYFSFTYSLLFIFFTSPDVSMCFFLVFFSFGHLVGWSGFSFVFALRGKFLQSLLLKQAVLSRLLPGVR